MYFSFSATTGPAVYVTTQQAPPLDQAPPTLMASAPDVVFVSWNPPAQLNGVILYYLVYRRTEGGSGTAFLVHRGDNSTFSFTNAGPGIYDCDKNSIRA